MISMASFRPPFYLRLISGFELADIFLKVNNDMDMAGAQTVMLSVISIGFIAVYAVGISNSIATL